MTDPLTRDEALEVLGVPPTAGADAVKQAYRRLARAHHPDLGGDPDTFHRLQRAFEQLVADLERTPPRPRVSRGRPSRPTVPFDPEPAPGDLGSVDWDVAMPAAPSRLDRDRLAVWLAAPDDAGGAVRALVATSRSPGSRLNRLAGKLAAELTSRLRITSGTDARGRTGVAIELVAANRRARRALDRAALNGTWTRTRRASSTSLVTSLPASSDRRSTAVRTTDRLSGLLTQLAWPLSQWTRIDTDTRS